MRWLPLLCAAAVASCARIGGPAPIVAHGASGANQSRSAFTPPPPVESRPGDIVVQRGDTLYGVARRTNAPMRAIIDANHLQPPYLLQAGQHLIVPRVRSYQVQPGETLTAVARRYGVGTGDLVRANALAPPYNLHTGQVLVLPPGAYVPTTVVATAAPAASPAAGREPPLAPATTLPRSATAIDSTALPSITSVPAPTQNFVPAAPLAAPPDSTHVAAALPPSIPAPPSAPAPAAAPASAPPPIEPAQPASLTTPSPEPQRSELEPIRGGRFLWPVRGTIVSDFGSKPGGLQNDGINIAAPRGTPIRAADSGVVVYAGNELRGFGNLLLVKHRDGWVTAYAHAEQLLVHRGEEVRRGQVVARVGSSGGVSSPQVHFEVRKGSRPLNPRDYLGPQTASLTP